MSYPWEPELAALSELSDEDAAAVGGMAGSIITAIVVSGLG